MPNTEPTPHRPQEARSARTRKRIIAATIECLLQLGYAATSTPEICRRAGLSRGALLHHFPNKVELVTTAITHLARKRLAELRRDALRLPQENTEEELLDALFELIWRAFSGPLFHGALELWVAARNDPELHAALFPAERKQAKALYELWRILPPQVVPRHGTARDHFQDLLALTLHLLRGMALQRVLRRDDSHRLHLFTIWKAIIQRELATIGELEALGEARPRTT